MKTRQETLAELHSCMQGIDKEITMILQNLQWDRKHLLEGNSLISCKYDVNHKVPPDKKAAHEEECFLRRQGYADDDKMLPDPVDISAPTIVKFSKEDITQIINKAAQADPSFKRGPGPPSSAPLTAERLQASFTADERRAIHDAVVSAAPELEYVDDLALPGTSDENKQRPKTKLEVLAELRNMRRRRTKYRGASAASKNYSNVLRDVIKTQMELFTGVKEEPDEPASKSSEHTRELFERRHHDNYERNNRHKNYRNEPRSERYDERNRPRDNKQYDSNKEKYRYREEIEKYERYDNVKHIKKEPDENFDEGNRHTSSMRREQYERHHQDNNRRDDRIRNYREESKTERYEEKNKSRDKKHSHKEKYRHREEKEKHKDRYDDKHVDDVLLNIKKEPEEYSDEGDGYKSYKSKHKRNDAPREPRSSYRDVSESRSERSYKRDKYYESSRSDRNYEEEYTYRVTSEDGRSSKRHREKTDRDHYDDTKRSKHRDSKRNDEYSYDKKRKRHS